MKDNQFKNTEWRYVIIGIFGIVLLFMTVLQAHAAMVIISKLRTVTIQPGESYFKEDVQINCAIPNLNIYQKIPLPVTPLINTYISK